MLSFVMRFLRVRRPVTFLLVGPVEDNDQALVRLVREKVTGPSYEVASGADTLLGIYEPSEKDAPVVGGLLYLDPIRIPVLTSDEPVKDRKAPKIKTVLERIVEVLPHLPSMRPPNYRATAF